MQNNNDTQKLWKPIPGNVPFKVSDTTQVPYCYTGILYMTFPDRTEYYGTAMLVAKNSGDTQTQYALTCAHNLYSAENGGKATNLYFIRAYNGTQQQPYAPIECTQSFFPQGYAIPGMENPDLDYGLIQLSTPVQPGGTIPILSALTDNKLLNMSVQINEYGYNEDKNMFHAFGNITRIDNNFLYYPITTMPGAAGSAIMSTNNTDIVGIHTRSTLQNQNQGTRFTAIVKAAIESWMI
jgi:V8-like Glu-specific endopeptidase